VAVDSRIAAIGRGDLACIIYTSGTGGSPRGVRQHHGMILRNIDGAARILSEDFGWDTSGRHPEAFLSFLPLSHAYEHTAGQFLPISLGTFTKGLGFGDLTGHLLLLSLFFPALTLLSLVLMRTQEA